LSLVDNDDEKDVEMMAPLMNGKESPTSVVAATTTTDMITVERERKAATSKVLMACGMYSFCSVSMVLTNKSLASGYVYRDAAAVENNKQYKATTMTCIIHHRGNETDVITLCWVKTEMSFYCWIHDC
jgi:hypothetical protein